MQQNPVLGAVFSPEIDTSFTPGLVLVNAAGKIEWANSQFEAFTGLACAAVKGKLPESIIPNTPSNQAAIECLRQQMAAGNAFTCTVYTPLKKASSLGYIFKGEPVLQGGGS